MIRQTADYYPSDDYYPSTINSKSIIKEITIEIRISKIDEDVNGIIFSYKWKLYKQY